MNRFRGQTQSFISMEYKSLLKGVLDWNPLYIVQKNFHRLDALTTGHWGMRDCSCHARSYNYVLKIANCQGAHPITVLVIGVNEYYISKAAEVCHDFEHTHRSSCMAYRSPRLLIAVVEDRRCKSLWNTRICLCFLVFQYYSIKWNKSCGWEVTSTF